MYSSVASFTVKPLSSKIDFNCLSCKPFSDTSQKTDFIKSKILSQTSFRPSFKALMKDKNEVITCSASVPPTGLDNSSAVTEVTTISFFEARVIAILRSSFPPAISKTSPPSTSRYLLTETMVESMQISNCLLYISNAVFTKSSTLSRLNFAK